MAALLRALAVLGTERPLRAVVFAALLTLAAGWVAGGLEISTSRTALVSADDPHWERYMAFSREFGIPEDLVVVVKGDSAAQVQATTDEIAVALRQRRDEVGSVFHRIDLNAFSARAPLYLGYPQIQLLKRLATEPAIAALRQAPSAAGRLAAINELLKNAPAMWSEGTVPTDFAAMSAVLRGVISEMRRFAVEEHGAAAPRMDLVDPKLLAEAVGDPLRGSGLNATGYLTTDEGRTAVMFVRPLYHTDTIEVVRPFVAAVRQVCERVLAGRDGITYGLTGIPASEIDEQNAIQHDTKVTSLVAVLGVVVLFLLYFPSIRLLLLALAPVLVGVVCTAAATRAMYGYLNLISSVFMVILIGMGIDFSIHISARFLELRAEGLMPTDAASTAVMKAGRGVLTGGLTSAGAFAAVGLSQFKAMAELGVVAAVGLLLTMGASLTLLPALLIIAGPAEPKPRHGFPGTSLIVGTLMKAKWPALIIALVATVPMAWAMTQAKFDYSLLNLLPKSSESAMLMAEMVDKRELSANAVIAVAPDLETARALEAKLAAKPTVFRTVSAASFIPQNQDTRLHQLRSILAQIKDQRTLEVPMPEARSLSEELAAMETNIERLQDLAFRRGDGATVAHLEDGLESIRGVISALASTENVKVRARIDAFTATLMVYLEEGIGRLERSVAQGKLSAEDLPDGVRERFVSAKGRYAVYAFPKESMWDRDKLGAFLKDAREVAPDVTGFPETFYENTGVMYRGFIEAAWYSSIAVLVLLLFDLRSFRLVLLGVFPLACGTIWMLGTMATTNINYNLANIVGLPLIIGVGIDNAVHLLHRYRQDGDVATALRRTGGAVVLSSMTTMVGFGSLSIASHRGLGSLGQILFIGVGCCLAAAMLALPAGLTLFGGKNK